ncbi:MAG: hypothetical protein KZQ83_17600 [gamma proteobacterium symbiont of Taylorina sp.]|nr:hypothetical protein [gamma proteobacterium symbiont of Taylorina sp.]
MSATAEQIITALYAGLFNSSPDAVELNHCLKQTAGGHVLDALVGHCLLKTQKLQ